MKPRHIVTLPGIMLLISLGAEAQQPPNPTNSDAYQNTAGGTGALLNLSTPTGFANTAFGDSALLANVNGDSNTAFGARALTANATGRLNTAIGSDAMLSVTSGYANTAVGRSSLRFNTTGVGNVALGLAALYWSTTGVENVAIGDSALGSNNGDWNVAVGAASNTHDGSYNVSVGAGSLGGSGTTKYNTAIGVGALGGLDVGAYNTALGQSAGTNVTTGSYNIHIGNPGTSVDSQTLRIGAAPLNHGQTDGQTRAFIAGIYGVSITGGSTVLINSSGQLGTIVSSGRFKKDVADMGDSSSRLMDLRPVTFHYKADPRQARQYGLIAEEVAKVYPDLVVRNDKGEIDSVAYHELAPMLLNELQKQHREVEALRTERERDVALLREMRAMLKEQAAVLTRLQAAPAESVRVAAR